MDEHSKDKNKYGESSGSQIKPRKKRLTKKKSYTYSCQQKSSDKSESNSDDVIQKNKQSDNTPATWRAANMMESDSVNENAVTSREPRRRRKIKHMDVDTPSLSEQDTPYCPQLPIYSKKRKSIRNSQSQKVSSSRKSPKISKVTQLSKEIQSICKDFGKMSYFYGKRKRCAEEKSSEYVSEEMFSQQRNIEESKKITNVFEQMRLNYSSNFCWPYARTEPEIDASMPSCSYGTPKHSYEVTNRRNLPKYSMEICSSGLSSSSESEYDLLNKDENREADDETSDFSHDPESLCPNFNVESMYINEDTFNDDFEVVSNAFSNPSHLEERIYGRQIQSIKSERRIRSARRQLGKKDTSISSKEDIPSNFSSLDESSKQSVDSYRGNITPKDKKKRKEN